MDNKIEHLSFYLSEHRLLDVFRIKTIYDFFNFSWEKLKNFKSHKVINAKSNHRIIESSIVLGDSYFGDFSLIRNSIIFGNVHIGFCCEINQSILFPGCHVPHHNFIGTSILGSNVTFGGNVRIANTRLDKKKVYTKCSEDRILYLNNWKAGSIIGDNTAIGTTVVICPGTLIGKNVRIEPMQVVKNFVPEGSYIKK